MPQAPPLITLLTDFGDRDWFVASMKGAILTINPAARIVDLTHHIAPHDIAGAAYVLGACYRSFPDGTIHVVVVDPGVGTARRPLLVSTSRCTFVAPDNGVLSHALAQRLQFSNDVCDELSGTVFHSLHDRLAVCVHSVFFSHHR